MPCNLIIYSCVLLYTYHECLVGVVGRPSAPGHPGHPGHSGAVAREAARLNKPRQPDFPEKVIPLRAFGECADVVVSILELDK